MTNKSQFHVLKKKSFIIVPILFAIFSYLLIYIAASPIIKPLLSFGNIVFFETAYDHNQSYKTLLSDNDDVDSPATVNLSDIQYPNYGDMFAHIDIENTSVSANVFFGDGTNQLNRGVGIYNGSFIPGYGKTILMAGHNNTFFNGLKDVSVGDKINIRTNYGKYVYKVTETRVVEPNYKDAYDLAADKENIILYTCYPFDMLGLTKYRFFVYGEYVSGPKIISNTQQGE